MYFSSIYHHQSYGFETELNLPFTSAEESLPSPSVAVQLSLMGNNIYGAYKLSVDPFDGS